MLIQTDPKYRGYWERNVVQAGFSERTVSPSDAEVALFPGEAVAKKSSASNSPRTFTNAYIGEYQVIFSWQAPVTTTARLVNGTIFRMKLVNNAGAELENDAIVIFLHKKPHQPVGVPFAFSKYAPWRNLTIAQQRDIRLNETCGIIFERPANGEPEFIELQPGQELQIAYTASAIVVDPTHSSFLIEFELGVKS